MDCLLPYLCMVTVPHIMVGLERMLDYRSVGLERMLDYRGVGLARFHCTGILVQQWTDATGTPLQTT